MLCSANPGNPSPWRGKLQIFVPRILAMHERFTTFRDSSPCEVVENVVKSSTNQAIVTCYISGICIDVLFDKLWSPFAA